MEELHQEIRLPHIFVVLSLSSTEDDAKSEAHDRLSEVFNSFEILHIELVEEGLLQTRSGPKIGKRYQIAFRELHGEVVFVHPDYDSIMSRFR